MAIVVKEQRDQEHTADDHQNEGSIVAICLHAPLPAIMKEKMSLLKTILYNQLLMQGWTFMERITAMGIA